MKIVTQLFKSGVDGKIYPHTYKLLEETEIKGFINHALYTDVKSYAVISLTEDGKHGTAVEVELPLKKTFNPEKAKAEGAPDGPCAISEPFGIKFTYGKWRDSSGCVLGKNIVPFCAYHYDLNF